MEKLINKLINECVIGTDTYTHNGSTWLIFTDNKQWVIELTKDRTLWYNYNFFKGMFNYVSMDVVENQHYITKWVENNVINGVRDIDYMKFYPNALIKNVIEKGIQEPLRVQDLTEGEVEEVIENGVKETIDLEMDDEIVVEEIIENGVRVISPMTQYTDWQVEEIIENGIYKTKHCLQHVSGIEKVISNGVKQTHRYRFDREGEIDNTIESGVKKTKTPNKDGDIKTTLEWIYENNRDMCDVPKMISEVIENGVKETNHVDVMGFFDNKMEDTLQNGVKKVKSMEHDRTTYHGHFNEKDGTHTPLSRVQDVIENGVKEIQPLPAQNGNRDWGNYYRAKKNMIKPHTEYLDEVINHGKLKTGPRNLEQFGVGYSLWKTETVIKEGVKNTELHKGIRPMAVNDTIQNGVKETHSVSKNLFWEIGDTIQNGVKKTISRENPSTMVDDIIKKTKADASQNPMGKVTEVLRDGKINK